MREAPNGYPLGSCKIGRSLNTASDGHRDTCHRCSDIRREGHSDVEHAALGPRVEAAKRIEINECGGFPGAPAHHRTAALTNRERATPNDCSRLGAIKTSAAGYQNCGGAGVGA